MASLVPQALSLSIFIGGAIILFLSFDPAITKQEQILPQKDTYTTILNILPKKLQLEIILLQTYIVMKNIFMKCVYDQIL